MTSTLLRFAALACGVALAAPTHSAYREISLADLHDKIEGGWAGQMIGVSFGAPTEFRFNQTGHRRTNCRRGNRKWSPSRSSRTISTST